MMTVHDIADVTGAEVVTGGGFLRGNGTGPDAGISTREH